MRTLQNVYITSKQQGFLVDIFITQRLHNQFSKTTNQIPIKMQTVKDTINSVSENVQEVSVAINPRPFTTRAMVNFIL